MDRPGREPAAHGGGRAVGDLLDPVDVDRVAGEEQPTGGVGHHDDGGGQLDDALEHAALVRRGIRGHRVQHHDDGHDELLEQRQQLLAVGAAEDAVLVLDHHDVELVERDGGRVPRLDRTALQVADDLDGADGRRSPERGVDPDHTDGLRRSRIVQLTAECGAEGRQAALRGWERAQETVRTRHEVLPRRGRRSATGGVPSRVARRLRRCGRPTGKSGAREGRSSAGPTRRRVVQPATRCREGTRRRRPSRRRPLTAGRASARRVRSTRHRLRWSLRPPRTPTGPSRTRGGVRAFACQRCRHLVYFDNTRCLTCGRELGFLPGPRRSSWSSGSTAPASPRRS